MAPQQRWWHEAGPTTQLLHFTNFFGRHFILVMDADGVKQVLSSEDGVPRPRFVKGIDHLNKVIGKGLVTMDGADWHRHRKIIQPSFHNHLLKDALNSCIPNLVDRMIYAWREREGSEIDLASHFSAIALDIIGTVAFSHDFRSMELVEQWAKDDNYQVELEDPLVQSIYANMMPSKLKLLLIRSRLVFLERFINPESHRSMDILNRAVDDVVKRAELRHKNRNEASTEVKCLLQLLFDAEPGSRHGSLSHKELREETKTFLVAGTILHSIIYLIVVTNSPN
jgi:cytochrome P450